MIKNFLYLDIEKLNSLSSQVFEGVTEYILGESFSEKEDSESQKGPVGSGRVLGDILKLGEKTSERKFLHDYSYTLFEEKLLKDENVANISASVNLNEINEKSFIKIKAKAIFKDINSINSTLENFNEIGKALSHVSNFENINTLKSEHQKQRSGLKDRNAKAKLDHQFKNNTNLNKIAKAEGLYQDQNFLNDLSFILKYGFHDQLEVQMEVEDSIFSANLIRENLRENENLIMRKYSRHTEVELVLFGVITQQGELNTVDVDDDVKEYGNLKEAILNLVAHMTNVESSFTGRLENEVVIDPIALYTEL